MGQIKNWLKRAFSADSPTQEEVRLDEVEKQGFSSGDDATNPYPVDTPEFEAWHDGHQYGKHLRETSW